MRFDRNEGQVCLLLAAVLSAGMTGCVGPEGDPGAPGEVGPRGEDGIDGEPGDDGEDGDDGIDGDDGDMGPPGDDGDDGEMGPPGDDGRDGANGRSPLLRLLDTRLTGWLPENRDALNALLRDYGASSEGFDASARPVAVFDWDNTMIRNDIGDATMFWMIANDKILQPPSYDWSVTNAFLSQAALDALNAACDALAAPGEPLPTSANAACADEIYNIYVNNRTAGGTAAFAQPITSTINQQYAWVAQLQSGYRPEEAREMAANAMWENLGAEIGATQTIGTTQNVTAWIRFYDEMRDLVGALQDNGFDVWVLTASPQYVVEVAAEEVGIRRDRVIGIRNVLARGELTYDFQGCGDVADGEDTLITFDRGKRCWINKDIYREPAERQMEVNSPERRPVFVAGDSDTDIAMLKDATVLKLVIVRNKIQTMCNALANYADSWYLQPQFINPAACVTTFDCDGRTDHDGNPIVDEVGVAIADQTQICI